MFYIHFPIAMTPSAPTDPVPWSSTGAHDAVIGDRRAMASILSRLQAARDDDAETMLLASDDIEALCDLATLLESQIEMQGFICGLAASHCDQARRWRSAAYGWAALSLLALGFAVTLACLF
jgi:hypothetical protein